MWSEPGGKCKYITGQTVPLLSLICHFCMVHWNFSRTCVLVFCLQLQSNFINLPPKPNKTVSSKQLFSFCEYEKKKVVNQELLISGSYLSDTSPQRSGAESDRASLLFLEFSTTYANILAASECGWRPATGLIYCSPLL